MSIANVFTTVASVLTNSTYLAPSPTPFDDFNTRALGRMEYDTRVPYEAPIDYKPRPSVFLNPVFSVNRELKKGVFVTDILRSCHDEIFQVLRGNGQPDVSSEEKIALTKLNDFVERHDELRRYVSPSVCMERMQSLRHLLIEVVQASLASKKMTDMPPEWLQILTGSSVFEGVEDFLNKTEVERVNLERVIRIIKSRITSEFKSLIHELRRPHIARWKEKKQIDFYNDLLDARAWQDARGEAAKVITYLELCTKVDRKPGALPLTVYHPRFAYNYVVDITPKQSRWRNSRKIGLHPGRLNRIIQRLSYQIFKRSENPDARRRSFEFEGSRYVLRSIPDESHPDTFLYKDLKTGNKFELRCIKRIDDNRSYHLVKYNSRSTAQVYKVFHSTMGLYPENPGSRNKKIKQHEYMWVLSEHLPVPSSEFASIRSDCVKGVLRAGVKALKFFYLNAMYPNELTVDHIRGKFVKEGQSTQLLYKVGLLDHILHTPTSPADVLPIEAKPESSLDKLTWRAMATFAGSVRQRFPKVTDWDDEVSQILEKLTRSDVGDDIKKVFKSILSQLAQYKVKTPSLKQISDEAAPEVNPGPNQEILLVDPVKLMKTRRHEARLQINERLSVLESLEPEVDQDKNMIFITDDEDSGYETGDDDNLLDDDQEASVSDDEEHFTESGRDDKNEKTAQAVDSDDGELNAEFGPLSVSNSSIEPMLSTATNNSNQGITPGPLDRQTDGVEIITAQATASTPEHKTDDAGVKSQISGLIRAWSTLIPELFNATANSTN